jgi:hypothetical protein
MVGRPARLGDYAGLRIEEPGTVAARQTIEPSWRPSASTSDAKLGIRDRARTTSSPDGLGAGRAGPAGEVLTDYAAPMTAAGPAAPAGTSRPRPLGVVLIAAFLVIDAVLSLAGQAFDLQTGTRQDILADADGRVSVLIVSLVALRVVAAVGLWLGWRRGWVLTMLLVGISLILDLLLYWNGQPLYLRMAIDVVVALYLNQGAVREYFERQAASADLVPPGDASASSP